MTVTRGSYAQVQDYVNAVNKGEYQKPSDQAILSISKLLDESVKKAYDNVHGTLKETKEFKKDLVILNQLPRTCGSFTEDNAIFANRTPFEQSSAVVEWVNTEKFKKIHTLTLKADDGIVPVTVKPPRGGSAASPMTTILGTTRGQHKAPAYSDFVDEDPKGTLKEPFIEALNCLEINRQPHIGGAVALKSSLYDNGILSHEERYKIWDAKSSQMAKEASVELKGQNTSPVKKIKEQSAGYNLTSFIENPSIRGKNLLKEFNYEDYSDEGYKDYGSAFLSTEDIVNTFPEALKGNPKGLDKLMSKVVVARIGISSIPEMQRIAIENLFKKT